MNNPRTPTPFETDGIHLAAESGNSESFTDNYHLDGNDDYSLSEKMVHYLGGYVTPDHWQACKACLVFQAGCLVSMMSCMSKAPMQSTILEGYNSIVGELDELHFGADARAFFLQKEGRTHDW